MEILRAIEAADALLPNSYGTEEKIHWCDEVSSEISRYITKKYDVLETSIDKNGEIVLPPGITYDLIEQVIINNKYYNKSDFRSLQPSAVSNCGINASGTISVVYLVLPHPIRITDIKGEFNVSENVIEAENAPFYEGDKIQTVYLDDLDEMPDYSSASSFAYVTEVEPERIILDRDIFEPQTAAHLAIRRIIDDVTVIDCAPYDRMYIEYILAKISLYQRDYTAYNAHMAQYNTLFEAARREFVTRSPLTSNLNFKNYSIV